MVLGRKVRGYRHEPNVAPDSGTETYVALKLGIDNWRWAGVPFYLRTGKYLSARTTEIAVQFRQAPYALFRDTPVERLPANILTLRIQPDEGLSLSFSAKRPGAEIEIDGVEMDFAYRDYFAPLASVGYETLIYDCLIGDATLFQRADTVEAAWCAVQGLLDAWARDPPTISPIMLPAAPVPRPLIACSRAIGVHGDRSGGTRIRGEAHDRLRAKSSTRANVGVHARLNDTCWIGGAIEVTA